MLDTATVFLLMIGSAVIGAFCYKLGKDLSLKQILKALDDMPDNKDIKAISYDDMMSKISSDIYSAIVKDVNIQLEDLHCTITKDINMQLNEIHKQILREIREEINKNV